MSDLCYIDKSQRSKNQVAAFKYIQKNITSDVQTITVEDFADKIEKYRTKNNTPLSYGSVKCLFYVMAKERTDWDRDTMRRYKNSFYNRKYTVTQNSNLYNTEVSNKISEMILFFIEHLLHKKFHDKCYIDTARAILITLATNFRISELLQLRKRHLYQILNCENIHINIKKKKKSMQILAHDWLLQALLETIKTEDDEYVLISTAKSTINKILRNYIDVDDKHRIKFGINSIRKVNTTLLIEHGNITIAQMFNRHVRSDVTQTYYNNKTYIGPTINRVMKANHDKKSSE